MSSKKELHPDDFERFADYVGRLPGNQLGAHTWLVDLANAKTLEEKVFACRSAIAFLDQEIRRLEGDDLAEEQALDETINRQLGKWEN